MRASPFVLLACLLASPAALAAPKLKIPDLPKMPKIPDIDLSKEVPPNPDDPLPGGVFRVFPVAGGVADGATSLELLLLALAPDGAARTGLVGTPAATGGACTALREAGGGLYRFTCTPARAEEGADLVVTLKAKRADGGPTFRGSWTFPAAPPAREQLNGTASPARLVLGRDKAASLAFHLDTSDRMAAGTAALVSRASVGTLGPTAALGNGDFATQWTAPAGTQPGLALVTAVDKRDPARAYAAVAVPLEGKVEANGKIRPRGRALVRAGGRTFGPVDADASGRVRIPLELAPGASAVLVEVLPDGSTSESPLDLKLPTPRRAALFPVGSTIPADARGEVPLRAFVVAADGTPDGAAGPVFTVSSGTVSEARHEGGGVYVATWKPAETAGGGPVTVGLSLGGPGPALDTVKVDTVGARAAKVTLDPPASVPKGPGKPFTVTARVAAPGGLALPGRTLRVDASGARVSGPVRDLKDGRYEVPMTSTGSGPIEVSVRASSPATGNPATALALVPSADRVAPDGLGTVTFAVHALDRWGGPVAGLAVDLAREGLDGELPASVTTDASGVAMAGYTAGRGRSVGAVTAQAVRLQAGAPLAQTELNVPTLGLGGSDTARALASELAAATATVRIARGE